MIQKLRNSTSYWYHWIVTAIDKTTVQRRPLIVLMEQYAAYSVSISVVRILFELNVNNDISMIKQENL